MCAASSHCIRLGEYYALGDATDSVSFATTYLRYVASFPRGQRGGLLSQEHLFRENLLKVFPMARISVIKRPNGLGQDIYGLRERAPVGYQVHGNLTLLTQRRTQSL
jgi:hypothetical protein